MLRSYFKQTALGCASVTSGGGVVTGPEAGAGAGAALITGTASAPVAVPAHPTRVPLLVIPPIGGGGSLPWLPSGTPPASPSSWGTWFMEDMASRSVATSPSGSSFTAESPASGQSPNLSSSKRSLDEARYLRSFDSWT